MAGDHLPTLRYSSRFVFALAFIAATGLLACSSARAEIILDDFDEPFEIALPQLGTDGPPIQQSGIGPLGVARNSVFTNLLCRPTGQVDADATHPSILIWNSIEYILRP